MHEEILATIPQADGEMLLEVALIHDAGGRTMVELRHLVWGGELGWYRQQTLSLDGATASQLLCRLSSVRQRLRPKRGRRLPDNIIAFPRRRPQRADAEPAVPTTMGECLEARSVSAQG
jgi:hypothetical protein